MNDYGRALWAGEIAGRLLSSKTEDELSETSGFLGMKELPWWLRPGIKARELAYQVNPPADKTTYITMQAEATGALFFDKDQKYGFIGSFGYVPIPQSLKNKPGKKPPEWIAREHYIRIQAAEKWWVSVGMTNKVYGIRIVDHTAYSKSKTGIAQNDQTHGVIVNYMSEAFEWSFHAFAGNLFQKSDLRQVGASTLLEYEVKPFWRIGITALDSSNDYVTHLRYGVLSRAGLGHGSSILFETGVIDNTPKNGTEKTQGYYLYTQATQKMFRGYHLLLIGQAYKADMVGDLPDNVKTGIGLLMFPRNNVEFRIDAEQIRQYGNSADVQPDSWQLMAQIHLAI